MYRILIYGYMFMLFLVSAPFDGRAAKIVYANLVTLLFMLAIAYIFPAEREFFINLWELGTSEDWWASQNTSTLWAGFTSFAKLVWKQRHIISLAVISILMALTYAGEFDKYPEGSIEQQRQYYKFYFVLFLCFFFHFTYTMF